MRKSLLFVATALVAVAVPSIAGAAINVKSEPVATFSGASVTVTGGNFSGLGNVPAIAHLTVTGTVTYTCANPQGHEAPGQNPVEAQPGTEEGDLGNSDHNGRGTITDMTATATAPNPPPSVKEVGCGGTGSDKGTKWTLTKPVVTATGANLTITQGSGNTVLFCRDYTPPGPTTGTDCL
jgi:hypothetical protein